MKMRIIRAALVLLAVILVLSVALMFPSFEGSDDAIKEAESETPSLDVGATEETLNADDLNGVLAGPAGPGFGGGGDREESTSPGDVADPPSSGVEDSGTIGQSLSFVRWLKGLPRILYFGGSQYVDDGGVYTNYAVDGFDEIVGNMHNVMRGLGFCIMFVCWIFGMCKSGISLDFNPGAKGGIIRSGLTLMLGLFLMEVSMEIMESLSVMCWAYCAELYENADMGDALSALLSDIGSSSLLDSLWTFIKDQAINIMSWIIEAVLVLNVAYMGVLQCFSPIFVGFAAGGEGTRRFATGFFKEYVRVCLVPSFIVVYCSLCFHLFLSSSVNWFLCIVLGISVFSISKKLDKIIT